MAFVWYFIFIYMCIIFTKAEKGIKKKFQKYSFRNEIFFFKCRQLPLTSPTHFTEEEENL